MNARSFITFFTYMLRQNGIPFWKELFVAVKMTPNITRNIFKKIFGGSQILTINATKFAGLDEIPIYPFACWNLKPAKLWSCFCQSFAWFCAHLTLFAERYASESFFFNFRHSPARVWEQCFKSLVFKKMGVGGGC